MDIIGLIFYKSMEINVLNGTYFFQNTYMLDNSKAHNITRSEALPISS